ncbi:hypothetical protein CI102_8874 [Trichoderma harzianum]|nr:hypothetical protein CI102_8874 [Trichoderma harzianum]
MWWNRYRKRRRRREERNKKKPLTGQKGEFDDSLMSWKDDGSTSKKEESAPKGDASKLRKATRHCRKEGRLFACVSLALSFCRGDPFF